MRGVFRRWLDRRRAARSWTIAKTWEAYCRWSDIDEDAGTILIAGEVNGLGKRRLVILNKVWGFETTQTKVWVKALRWREGLSPAFPHPTPKKPSLRVVK